MANSRICIFDGSELINTDFCDLNASRKAAELLQQQYAYRKSDNYWASVTDGKNDVRYKMVSGKVVLSKIFEETAPNGYTAITREVAISNFLPSLAEIEQQYLQDLMKQD